MNEGLFRGKRKDIGEWAEGSLVNIGDKRLFIAIQPSLAFGPNGRDEINEEVLWSLYPFFEVEHSTVGQAIGRTDKKDKNIFVGDICEYNTLVGHSIFYISSEDGAYYANFITSPLGRFLVGDLSKDFYNRFIEVIGNIYDNPELLEVKQ